jgi:Sulfotransferase family
MSARAPDFFIVGHHKSGTTALYEMLRRHPQIYMPDLKEPRFLASELAAPPPAGRPARHPQTLDEYLALFAPAAPEQRVGEASATYLWSRTAAGRIAELQPGARIIAILREPTSFLRSLHLTYLRINFEDQKDLRKAMSLEPARREGKRIPARSLLPALLQYSDQVHYVEQLTRYRELFSPEQMLVLIYDDFLSDNASALQTVLQFLQVDDEQSLQPIQANVTTWAVRSQQTEDLLRSVALGRGGLSRLAKTAAKAVTTRRVRHAAMRTIRRRAVISEPPPPDQQLMLELRRRFKPEVVALSDYLGRDLVALWGYDALD